MYINQKSYINIILKLLVDMNIYIYYISIQYVFVADDFWFSISSLNIDYTLSCNDNQ